MGQKWNNALADVTAGFPGAVWAGMSTRLEDLNGYTVTGEVIGASLWTLTGGRYRAFLDLVPLEQATFVCVDASEDDEPLTKIPWGETPAADEVAVSLEHGGVEVHASRSTHNIRGGCGGGGVGGGGEPVRACAVSERGGG